MSSEIKSYTELPASESNEGIATEKDKTYAPFDDEDNETHELSEVVDPVASKTSSVSSKEDEESEVEQYKSVLAEAINESEVESLPQASKVSVNYESMTIKELQTLAKSRGITGAGSMKKGAIIEALKTSDRSLEPGHTITGGSNIVSGSSSFLDTSSTFQPSTESS
jgi:glutamine synthetase adenylyltransferase